MAKSVRQHHSIMPTERPGFSTVVVIGGGFAGLAACRTLRKKFNVILVDAKEYFEYYPGILRAYVHPIEHRKLYAMYQQVCDKMEVRFIWGEAKSVDPDKKTVLVNPISRHKDKVINFHYLIVCSGSQYGLYMNYDNRASSAAECLWYPSFLEKTIKTSTAWEDMDERFLAGRRAHFEYELEVLKKMATEESTIVIVGAGFVGIEFATEVKYYFPGIEVVVVEARDACVAVMPPRCRQYCQRYMDKAGIKTIYKFNYKSLSEHKTSLAEYGVAEPARVYMAVGVRSINQFLPKECLDAMKYDEGTGDCTRGGFIVANKKCQIMVQSAEGEKPWGNGLVFAAGNCCQIQGMRLPKNSFPGEDMASIACHNIMHFEKRKNSKWKAGGCFAGCRLKKMKEIHWNWGMGLCATSLGPHDATFVVGSTEASGSGYQVLTGCLSAQQKEFIRWSKVNQCRMGWLGNLIWGCVH